VEAAVEGESVKLQLVSKLALVDYMKAADHSIRSLALATGVHRCTIDRLHGGRQKTLGKAQAKLLEQELGAPDGRLFRMPKPTRDSRRSESRKSDGEALVA